MGPRACQPPLIRVLSSQPQPIQPLPAPQKIRPRYLLVSLTKMVMSLPSRCPVLDESKAALYDRGHGRYARSGNNHEDHKKIAAEHTPGFFVRFAREWYQSAAFGLRSRYQWSARALAARVG